MYDKEMHDHVAARCAPDENGCLVWQKSKTDWGYGQTIYRDKFWRAHRAMFVAVNGPLDAGVVVRHKCDNPPCCNPLHLEPGSHADNKLDSAVRGRVARKLSAEQVLAIRAADKTTRELAEIYGVTHSVVAKIRRRATWAWM